MSSTKLKIIDLNNSTGRLTYIVAIERNINLGKDQKRSGSSVEVDFASMLLRSFVSTAINGF
jgi:hypothetical protein